MYRLYLGRLSHRANERDIEKFFKGFGRIRDIMLKNGYGFVEFEDYRDADDAVYELNGQMLCGERVVIEHARGTPHGEDLRRDLERGMDYPPRRPAPKKEEKSSYRTDYRIIIENLSSRVTWQDLKEHMRTAGEVTYADAHREHKNEGIVEYASRREMERALDKLDGSELFGRRIRLVEHNRKAKKRSRSRSLSRKSRSRSRSSRCRSSGRRGGKGGRRGGSSPSRSRSEASEASRHSDDEKERDIKDRSVSRSPEGKPSNGHDSDKQIDD